MLIETNVESILNASPNKEQKNAIDPLLLLMRNLFCEIVEAFAKLITKKYYDSNAISSYKILLKIWFQSKERQLTK